MATRRTNATTCTTLRTLTYVLLLISSSPWQTQARKTNWNEINSVLKPRTQGLHNYDSELFKRSQTTDAFNETWVPLTIDKDEKERKGSKGPDDTKQGEKNKASTRVTPPPKAAPAKKTSSPTVLDDDIFFVVPPSKERDKKSPRGSPAPTASMPPSAIPSTSPAPTFSPRPTILRRNKTVKSKESKTIAPTGPYGESKKAMDSEKNRKSKKALKNDTKTIAPVPSPLFNDGEPKFSKKKSRPSADKGNGKGKGSGKGGMKEDGHSSKAKLKKSKSSKSFVSERPSVAPTAVDDSSPPVLGSPTPGLPETSKCIRSMLYMIVVIFPLATFTHGSFSTSLCTLNSHFCAPSPPY